MHVPRIARSLLPLAAAPGAARLCGWVIVALLVGSSGARAHEPDTAMNRVSFRVEATREVQNDRVRAVIGTSDEDRDPAALADRVNQTMSWALERARKAEGIRVESGSYHTQPVYNQRKIERWRASQDLVLEGSEVAQISELISELQTRLQLRSIAFSVSSKRRRSVQDSLIEEALDAFRQRAERVRKRNDVELWTVTTANRDSLAETIVRWGGW